MSQQLYDNNPIYIQCYPDNLIAVNVHRDSYRITYNIFLDQSIIDIINWAKRYKNQLDNEIKLRSENPALASQYEEYQTMLKLVNE